MFSKFKFLFCRSDARLGDRATVYRSGKELPGVVTVTTLFGLGWVTVYKYSPGSPGFSKVPAERLGDTRLVFGYFTRKPLKGCEDRFK